jgi:hypothetical protein
MDSLFESDGDRLLSPDKEDRLLSLPEVAGKRDCMENSSEESE